jgi:hypothetical protein
MLRKPNVTLQSIKRIRELKSVNRVIVRKDSEYLTKLQPKTTKKLP